MNPTVFLLVCCIHTLGHENCNTRGFTHETEIACMDHRDAYMSKQDKEHCHCIRYTEEREPCGLTPTIRGDKPVGGITLPTEHRGIGGPRSVSPN